MPPLCLRGDDILILSRHFLNQHTQRLGRPSLDFSPTVKRALLSYPWPGNVRELNNEMERLAALTIGSEIVETDLSARIRTTVAFSSSLSPASDTAKPETADGIPSLPYRLELDIESEEGAIAKAERLAVIKALAQSNGNKTRAAEILGISREGLRKKLKKMEIA
jgi:DNA-binding NtrC family response regulator